MNKPNCLDCGVDITHRHKNSKRCGPCSKIWRVTRFRIDPTAISREVSPSAVCEYMKQHTPKALADIKRRIKEMRSEQMRNRNKVDESVVLRPDRAEL